ncbi:MAG: GxxExxY protein [Pseudomonadota bacterium]|nr:GxxExxY protein [Pseudomonadota bacterium]
MNTNEHKYILKEETQTIIGCAMEVLNTMGYGLLEKPYENALVIEFKHKKIPHIQQPGYKVLYKGVQVGKYIPDLIVYDQIIVDIKVIEMISNHEIGQMINYLKITGCKVGVIINFKRSKIEWKRIVI